MHPITETIGTNIEAGVHYLLNCGLLPICIIPVIGLFLAAPVHAESPASIPSSPDNLWQEDAGPKQLIGQTRVTVDTNAPVAGASNKTNESPWRVDWRLRWKDWDGLHFSLVRRTLFGQQVRAVTNIHAVNLEETRMAGKIGGKFALDAAAFLANDDFDGFDNGIEMRRARVYAKGDCLLLIPVSYELEIGYVPGSFYIENSYLQFPDLSFLGDLKFGQFQVPMSMVNYGSSRDMMFMESASPLQALAPGVNAGFQIGRPVFNHRMTWAFGLFTDPLGDDFGDATKNFGRAVGRVTGLVLDKHDPGSPHAQHLLHLGLSSSLLYAGDRTVRYRSRPESHLAPYVVDTGDIPSDGALTLGAEAAWVRGPLCVQGEFLHSWAEQESGHDLDFGGFYASASWLLTGESRTYDRTKGTFGRLVPKRNFNFGGGGWGAWEIAARYSHVDLSSGAIDGGRLAMLMSGVNWYLHSHVKWRFNYGFGQVSGRDPDGHLNILQTRIEVDF